MGLFAFLKSHTDRIPHFLSRKKVSLGGSVQIHEPFFVICCQYIGPGIAEKRAKPRELVTLDI